MTTPSPELQRALEQLRREYAAKLPADLQSLDCGWERLRQDWGGGELNAFRRLIHKLCGSAGMYGFAAISHHACPLDLRLRGYQGRSDAPAAEELAAIALQLEQLKTSLRQAVAESR